MEKMTGERMAYLLEAAFHRLKVGSRWQHYKGGVYEVTDFAILTATDEVGVIYRRIDGPDYNKHVDGRIQFARPLAEWFQLISVTVGDGSVPDDQVPRFQRVEQIKVWQTVKEEDA